MRARAAAAALLMAVLMAGPLSACDGSGPPNDADLDEFCDAYYRLFSGDLVEIDPRDSEADQAAAMVEALRTWAKKLEQVGTPDDMSDQAREGFELIMRAAADLEPGDVDNLAQLGEDFSEVEMAATEAFEDYATQHCESPFGDPPTAKRRP